MKKHTIKLQVGGLLYSDRPSIRDLKNDTMNRKIASHNGKTLPASTTAVSSTRVQTLKIGKVATDEEKRTKAEDENKKAQLLSQQQARKDWVQGSMEEAYKSPLMSPGYATPEGLAIGAIQGATKIGPDLNDGNYVAAGFDLLQILPIMSNIKTMYKLNPYAEKLNTANKSYRVAGHSSYEDFLQAKVVRSKNMMPENPSIQERFAARPTSFPSFQKGFADTHYLPKEGGVIYETAVPTFRSGEVNPVTGKTIGGRHYAHRPIDMKTGKVITELPSKDVRVFQGKPHWLKGFQEMPAESNNYLQVAVQKPAAFAMKEVEEISANNVRRLMAGRASDSTPLPKNMEPYISRYEKPISREQEVFENSFPVEQRSRFIDDRTVHLDNAGNTIRDPRVPYTGPTRKHGGLLYNIKTKKDRE